MKIKSILCGLTICLSLVSCLNSENVKVGQVEEFKIKKFSGTKIECSSSIEIINESVWPITLKNKEMQIFSGDKKLGVVNFSDAIKIKAKTNQVYDFHFTVEITDVQLGFSSLVGNILGNGSEYRLKGEISACSILICKNIEVNEVLMK